METPRRSRRRRRQELSQNPVTMGYEGPSASLQEAIQRISAAKRERNHFCPIMSPPAAKRRRLARMKKKEQRRLVSAGLQSFVATSVSKDIVPYEFKEALKATYPGRSYYGRPEYVCEFCGCVFWFQERVKTESAFSRKRIVYNLCCKSGKVSLPPFKPPPALGRIMGN